MDKLLALLIRLLVAMAKHTKWLASHGIGKYEEYQPGEPVKILLVGYNGARNTGADARVVGITKQLQQIFGPNGAHITVMTLDEENLAGYFDGDVQLFKFTTFFPLALYRACSVHHMVILSEGSTLKSTFADALTLFFCEASGIMHSQKKPCVAYGSEAGAMSDYLKKIAAELCRDTYFIARTEESMGVLRSLDLSGHVGTDTAWRYDGAVGDDEAKEWLKQEGWDGNKPCIGAAVIDPFCWPVRASLWKWCRGKITGKMAGCYDKWYFFSESPERADKFENYISGIAAAVNRFARERDCFVVVIGMERLDGDACRSLRSKLEVPSGLLLSGEYPAAQMTGVIRQLSYLVTSRYHAAVLSMERGLPIVSVSMDERLDSLMRECALDHVFLHHAADENLDREIYGSLKRAAEDYAEIREMISEQFRRYQSRLDAMGTFLEEYVGRKLALVPTETSKREMCK